jgi:hypothetical protein
MKGPHMQRFVLIAPLFLAVMPSGCDRSGPESTRNVREPAAAILDQRVSIDCEERALTDVIHDLRKQTRIGIQVERDALSESYHLMPLVTCSLQDVPLGEALSTILSPHGLAYLIVDNVIVIVRQEGEESG